MRSIKRIRFRDQVAAQLQEGFRWDRLRFLIYYRKRHLITRFFMAAAVTFVCLFCGLFSREGLVLGLSFLSFLVILYLQTKVIAENIRFKRIAPPRAREQEYIKIKYEMINGSRLQVSNFILSDSFSGNKKKIHFWQSGDLRSGERKVIQQQLLCDGGMGVHRWTPLVVTVSDPMGFFEFAITEDEVSETFIHPRLTAIPNLPVAGSKDSLQYGIHDVSERGASVNFIRVREYVRGDPIKQICWRLSFRHQKLMVKEFEKIVNAEITILLDMDRSSR